MQVSEIRNTTPGFRNKDPEGKDPEEAGHG
jgi:hypothetical protein